MTAPDITTLLTPRKVAEITGLGRTLVMRLIREGKIPAVGLCGRFRVRATDLQTFIDSLPSQKTGAAVPHARVQP
jgi:excisionase family DNA binding protein